MFERLEKYIIAIVEGYFEHKWTLRLILRKKINETKSRGTE
jgi:hypothetical protein